MAGARRPAQRLDIQPSITSQTKRIRQMITPEGVDLRLELAEASGRVAAFIIDILVILAVLIMFWLILLAVFFATGKDGREYLFIVFLLGGFFLRNFYFVAWELTPGAATIGKRVLGLRVAARSGGRLDSNSIFARNAMRELEFFLPLSFLLTPGSEWTQAGLMFLGLLWTGVFLFFPLFNRDRLRVGDLVAGTWVVRTPKRRLDIDLSDQGGDIASPFTFSPEQTGAYGVKELHVLENVLRRKDRHTMAAVALRIRTKIQWVSGPDESDQGFLNAYYTALRGRLESRLLFGHRRKDKFDKA